MSLKDKIDMFWLQQAIFYLHNNLTYKQVLVNVHLKNGDVIPSISKNTSKEACKLNNLDVKLTNGRKFMPVPPNLIESILKFQDKYHKVYGYKNIAGTIVHDLYFLNHYQEEQNDDENERMKWFNSIDRSKESSELDHSIPSFSEEIPNRAMSISVRLQLADYLVLPLEPPTSHMVMKAMVQLNLQGVPRPPKKEPLTRYVFKYVNTCWHVDIHFFGGDQHEILYAIIDDASRFVLDWQHLSTKQAHQTTNVLKRAIARFGKPCAIWSDNGGENRGVFTQALLALEIRAVRIEPHCPYQNGKIEAFWPGIEQRARDWSEIQSIVDRYNNKMHSSLPKITLDGMKVRSTPLMFYETTEKWHEGMQPIWDVNDKELIFEFKHMN